MIDKQFLREQEYLRLIDKLTTIVTSHSEFIQKLQENSKYLERKINILSDRVSQHGNE